MQNKTAWGQIPGQLSYKYTKNVTLYSIDDLDPDRINMTEHGPYSFNLERKFVDLVYDDHKKVINYTMQHNYTQMPSDVDLSNTTIN